MAKHLNGVLEAKNTNIRNLSLSLRDSLFSSGYKQNKQLVLI